MSDPYAAGLERNAANFMPLTPLDFLVRTAAVHPDRLAVVHGARRYSWAETYSRCRRLASALTRRGIGKGDTVAVMGANTPELFEAHFGVPMAGAVLNALNIRLDADTIAFILKHGEAKALITDREFAAVIEPALAQLAQRPLVIDIDDTLAVRRRAPRRDRPTSASSRRAIPTSPWQGPADEWDAIALNYTSGTTGNPKGVVYHHRGAYLTALGNALVWTMPRHPVYLWTLPMFHCNGWCFPWTVTALAGTHVCLRRVEAGAVFAAIAEYGVTHLCGAPMVMNMLLNAPASARPRRRPPHRAYDRGLGPARGGHRGHGGAGLRHHPCLWPDRGLRAGRGVRLARRMGARCPRPSRRRSRRARACAIRCSRG